MFTGYAEVQVVYNVPKSINFRTVRVNITHDTRLLTDGNDTSCITVSKTFEPGNNFRTKFPWPVLGSASQTFKASLIGNSIHQCSGMVRFDTLLEGEQQEDTGRRKESILQNDPGMDADTGELSVTTHVPVERMCILWCTCLYLIRTLNCVK